MDFDYWHKQNTSQPLFPELLWSRPENRAQAGKLLIAGGNSHGFSVPAAAYDTAMKSGIGTARVLLPDSLQKMVGKLFASAEFAPSTPSGSFSRQALAPFLDGAAWADSVLLAGEMGRNSETAILLESFATTYRGQLTITRDAADYFSQNPQLLNSRPDTLLVISLSQLQAYVMHSKFSQSVQFSMGLLQLIKLLHDFTTEHQVSLITKHLDNLFVAVNGEVSTTKCPAEGLWRVGTAAKASVWWLQNPAAGFRSLTAAAL